VVIVDQALKALVAATLPAGASVPVVPRVLSLTHVQNRGVAFGLLSGISPVAAAIGALTLFLMLFYNRGRRSGSRADGAGLALMAGGAVGNLLDRVRLGFVIDYLDLHVWPVFNLADVAIVVGAGMVMLALVRHGPGAQPRR
jgi:signal peptidase II